VDEMLGAVRRVTGLPVEARYGPVAPGDVHSTWADSARAAHALGYRPRVGLEEGIAAQAEWAASLESLAGATVS
jgi:UDP-glucuronate 4-epimerase